MSEQERQAVLEAALQKWGEAAQTDMCIETRKFRPVKIEQRARIDGFVSVIDAMTVRQKYYNEIGVMLKNAG